MHDTKPFRVFQAALVLRVAMTTRLSMSDADDAVREFLRALMEELADGCTITLPGFGTFATTDRPAQQVRDIRTGRVITIPAHRRVTFRAGKDLRYELREADDFFAT
jgi:DNA-binding protein HU-beta